MNEAQPTPEQASARGEFRRRVQAAGANDPKFCDALCSAYDAVQSVPKLWPQDRDAVTAALQNAAEVAGNAIRYRNAAG